MTKNSQDILSKKNRFIKKGLELHSSRFHTHIVALAVCSKGENAPLDVPVYGEPLNYAVYDLVRDVYSVECVSSHTIGRIPLSYRVGVEDSLWEVHAAIPTSVIKQLMSKEQKELYLTWSSQFGPEQYRIYYLQSLVSP